MTQTEPAIIPNWAATDPERFLWWIYHHSKSNQQNLVEQIDQQFKTDEARQKFWMKLVRLHRFDPAVDGPWVMEHLDTAEQLVELLDTFDLECEDHWEIIEQFVDHDHMRKGVLRRLEIMCRDVVDESDSGTRSWLLRLSQKIEDRYDEFDDIDRHPDAASV